jgi:hypothetical protein
VAFSRYVVVVVCEATKQVRWESGSG